VIGGEQPALNALGRTVIVVRVIVRIVAMLAVVRVFQ
jgi:hypothetical protein